MHKRLFIAIDITLNDNTIQYVDWLKYKFEESNIKWIKKSQMHLTIKFLGNTDENKLSSIISCIDKSTVASSEFQLTLKSFGFFGKLSAPQIIWIGTERNKTLSQIHRILEENLNEINIEKDKRLFKPHITIGRVKHIENLDLFHKTMNGFENTSLGVINVSQIILFESRLTPTGPIYNILHQSKL